MAGPWERYSASPATAPAAPAAGPWAKYSTPDDGMPLGPKQREQLRKSQEPKEGSTVRDIALGFVRGVADLGDTALSAGAKAADFVASPINSALGQSTGALSAANDRRLAAADGVYRSTADTDSLAYGVGRVGGNIVATAPVGGVLGAGAKAVGATRLGTALASGGLRTGAAIAPNASRVTRAADLGLRSAAGAATGGASTALVSPEDAGLGAVAGGVLPPALRGVGRLAGAAGRAVRGSSISPEVAALASRAEELGITIPADRLASSKPLDALASGLNYVPFSGRAATEATMGEQLNRAASRLMGQDTPNINQALRAASEDLGAKFDATLKNTGVRFDERLLGDLADVFNTAERELGGDALKPIASQIDELVQKGESGVIDGQAAYNIKRTLDRIGRSNTPAAHHALELKRVLMGALDRSLGEDGAAAFAQTRQQYGNMLALEKLARNGAEGEISVTRLANLTNINNEPLQELADIAAQFVRKRESPHGSAQRGVLGLVGAGTLGPLAMGGLMAGSRVANMALNSSPVRSLMLGQPQGISALQVLANPRAQSLGYRAAPVVLAGDQ